MNKISALFILFLASCEHTEPAQIQMDTPDGSTPTGSRLPATQCTELGQPIVYRENPNRDQVIESHDDVRHLVVLSSLVMPCIDILTAGDYYQITASHSSASPLDPEGLLFAQGDGFGKLFQHFAITDENQKILFGPADFALDSLGDSWGELDVSSNQFAITLKAGQVYRWNTVVDVSSIPTDQVDEVFLFQLAGMYVRPADTTSTVTVQLTATPGHEPMQRVNIRKP